MTIQSGMGTAGIVAIPIPPGGLTGAVLTKSSEGNYDYEWEPPYGGFPTRFLIQSDFTDPPGALVTPNLHGVGAGAGAQVAGSITDPQDHPGIWRLLTGTSTAGRFFIISIAGGTLVGTIRVGSGITRVGTWLHTGADLSDGTDRYFIRSGLFAISLPTTIDEGIGFEYIDNENSGAWQAICDDAPGVETSVDTGVTVTASTWYKLEFEVNTDADSVEFFIDDVSVATITTNIPLGAAFHLFYNTNIQKVLGTTSREFEIDAMYMYKEINR